MNCCSLKITKMSYVIIAGCITVKYKTAFLDNDPTEICQSQ